MNNYQWLLQMDGADRKAWFDAEHVGNQERALDGDTVALNAKIAELTAERDEMQQQVDELTDENDELQTRVYKLTANLFRADADCERYREKFGKCLDYADAIHALMDDEGMA